MKKTRVAVIGAGRWGKNIVKTLQSLPECDIVYVETKDHRVLVEKTDIDAVVVATPGATHATVALPFIKRGWPVFIEKPFTTSLADARKLHHAARKSGALVFVGHLHLHNPPYRKIKRLLPRIGAVRWIHAEGANNGPYRDDMSALWDWAPHDVALMLDLLGKMPRRVQAWEASLLRPRARLGDIAFIKLEFPGKVVGFIFNSWLFPEKRKKVSIIGEKGSIVFDDTAEKKVTLYEHMGPVVSGKKITRQESVVSFPSYEPDSPLSLEMRSFLKMAKKKEKSPGTRAEGLKVVKVLDAAERSVAAGGTAVGL
jgi:UDP-2-acetamido-3-amino-2,3-dideoxy-glucuronate N-acetyltransferase